MSEANRLTEEQQSMMIAFIGEKEAFCALVREHFENGNLGFSLSEGDGWYGCSSEIFGFNKETDELYISVDISERIGWSDEWEYYDNEETVDLETFWEYLIKRKFGSDTVRDSFMESVAVMIGVLQEEG